MSVRIQLANTSGIFTNLDVISGRILLNLDRAETFVGITVKLECESRTRLATPREDRRDRYDTELEVHKLLYKTQLVFPTPDVQQLNQGSKNANFTLQAAQHEWPFSFKIPFNNACAPVNSIFDRADMGRDYVNHVKRALPPTLAGFPGEAEIKYYVKVTAQRAAFYKENYRAIVNFVFLPLEPIRPPPNKREAFARRTFQFAPHLPVQQKTGIFRKPSVIESGDPPNISIDGRLPDPPILTCNQPLPLRVLVKKLNETSEIIYLNSFQLVLIGFTKIRAHELTRVESSSWVISSKANLNVPLGTSTTPKDTDLEIDKNMWNSTPLLNSICPTFETCNLSRNYELEIRVGLVHGTPKNMKPELSVQTLRMPCKLYSGIKPPQALIDEMSRLGQNVPQPKRTTSNQSSAPPTFTESQAATNASQRPSNPPVQSTEPAEPPPSYEDAIADDLGPVDGNRGEYEQPQSAPVVGDEKRPSLFGH